MIRRRVSRDVLTREPYVAWNEFVDLLAMEEYEDLDPVQRVAHLAFWYDSEVQNGGHLQYFENQGTDLLQPTLAALEKLGASSQGKILSRGGEIYQSQPRTRISTPDEYVKAALKGEFDDLDDAYYSCEPTITDLLEDYLASNKDAFIEET